jgi:hypothetical protein
MTFPRLLLTFAASFGLLGSMSHAELIQADIVVFGGTSGGIAAAVQAHRMGKTAVIAEWTQHLGGLTTGGLGATDIGSKTAIGGMAREFYEAIAAHYDQPSAWVREKGEDFQALYNRGKDAVSEKRGKRAQWRFEPHVAMGIYEKWLKEAGVKYKLGERLRSVKKEGARILEFTTESGNTYRGKMFIDASYEGDLMAKAGVSYHVGRESNTTYGETLNGVRAETPNHQFDVPVDPYNKPGDSASGLIPLVQSGDGGKVGEGDKCVQAYNYRLCLTQDPENQVSFLDAKPANYDEKQFELAGRLVEARLAHGKPAGGLLITTSTMPNRKTDSNNRGPVSSDYIGANYAYPDADYDTREKIAQEHRDYTLGLLYFMATSSRVPKESRDEVLKWGLAKDEFTATGHFPPQMYVREARRMISDYVMVEDHCRGKIKAEDGVALGAYGMDSHNCQRLVQNGVVRNEGNVEVGVAGPYAISYRSIIPKAAQAENLLVPICLAASHIAYGSIRMEPVFMITGQSSATAAALAIDAGVTVQKLTYAKLRERLVADHQIVEWTGPLRTAAEMRDALPVVKK